MMTQRPASIKYAKVELLKNLLEIYTEEQLWQFVRKSIVARCATGDQQIADVTVRFKSGHPRFFGVQTWEEAEQ